MVSYQKPVNPQEPLKPLVNPENRLKPIITAEGEVKNLKDAWERNIERTERLLRLYGETANSSVEYEKLMAARKIIETQLDAALVKWAEEMERQLAEQQPD
jgi:hypothetical protein